MGSPAKLTVACFSNCLRFITVFSPRQLSTFHRRQRFPPVDFQEGISRLESRRDVGQVRAARLAQRRYRYLAPIGPAAENVPQVMRVHIFPRLHDLAGADFVDEAMPVVI